MESDIILEFDKDNDCPICYRPFENPLVLEFCDHMFCKDCLD